MVIQDKRWTMQEFDRFVALPENVSRNFELIAGEVIEKMVSSPRSSTIGLFIGGSISVHVRRNDLGWVSGADGGYLVAGEKYIPDAAFISKLRQPVQPSDAYNPLAPDLAVEVLSPSNSDDEMRIKIAHYMAAGTLLWVVDPDRQRVEVYRSGQLPKILLGINDTLDGGDVLPGFTVAVKEIFG